MCDDIIDIAALKLHRKSKTVQNNEGTGPDDLEEESEMHEVLLEGLRIEESQSVKLVCKKFCTLSLFVTVFSRHSHICDRSRHHHWILLAKPIILSIYSTKRPHVPIGSH
jgi:hypothetical protein